MKRKLISTLLCVTIAVILAVIVFLITALNFKFQDKWVKTMD